MSGGSGPAGPARSVHAPIRSMERSHKTIHTAGGSPVRTEPANDAPHGAPPLSRARRPSERPAESSVRLAPTPARTAPSRVLTAPLRVLIPSPRSLPLFPCLSRGETQGRASGFVKEEDASPSRDGRATSPLPGEGGTGWVDRQRYRRLVPFPFYPSFSPLSRGETWGQAPCFVKGDASPSRDAAPREARDRHRPGRSIDWSGTNAGTLRPFSRGRRLPAFAGTGRKRGRNGPLFLAPVLSTPLHGMTSLRSALDLSFPGERLKNGRECHERRRHRFPTGGAPAPTTHDRFTIHNSRLAIHHPASKASERSSILYPQPPYASSASGAASFLSSVST
jgi:hypothetical protein